MASSQSISGCGFPPQIISGPSKVPWKAASTESTVSPQEPSNGTFPPKVNGLFPACQFGTATADMLMLLGSLSFFPCLFLFLMKKMLYSIFLYYTGGHVRLAENGVPFLPDPLPRSPPCCVRSLGLRRPSLGMVALITQAKSPGSARNSKISFKVQ